VPEKILAKVDYIKPLQDKPYSEVVAETEGYHKEVQERLIRIVGREQIKDDQETLTRYSRDASLQPPGRASFVVFPENVQQLRELVLYANEMRLPVVPASSGTHAYGSALPRMGGIVVDLSGWKKIHKIDYRNRAVRIDPGVTYDQLQKELEKEGLRALMPLLPRRDQSVLTAHLEAHPMLIPEFNYSEPLYTAEIIMPQGDVFRTGAAAMAPPETTHTDLIGPWGPGFDWNRLYTRSQGTLGIITWANIMAEPLPVKQKLYFTPFSALEDLVSFTYKIQRRWIGYECFALNRSSLAMMLGESMPGDYLKLKRVLPAYTLLFCIGGLKRFPDERIAYQEADLMETAREYGVSPQPTLPDVPQAAPFFEKHLRRCWHKDIYWKDAHKGASADIFFLTTMEKAPGFLAALKEEAAQARYEPDDIGVYLQPIENGRVCHLEFTMPYNPADAHESGLVRKLHRSASERMYAHGAHYTRAYGIWAEMVYGSNAVHYQTAKMIKETLDPNNIMNPGIM
jgi:FAD/FMN-containing dehydrogenase